MAITSGLFDQYLPTKELVGGIATNVKTPTSGFTKEAMTATTAPTKEMQVTPITRTPRDLLDLAEEGQPATADPVETVYEGDNRPTYIKERTNITAEQYNQFLSEFDDAVAQAGLDYRQAILQQRIEQEATGTVYRPDSQVLENQALQDQLFQSAVKDIAAKYGVPLTYTTKGGERWDLNANGKYTRTSEVGGWDDYLKAAVKIAITTVATAGLGSAVAAGLGAAGVPTSVANVIADVVVGAAQGGGDIKQGIINAFAPVPDELRQVTDYFPDGLEGIVDIARSVYDTANAETQPDVTTDFEVNIDPEQTDPITVDEDTGDVTVGLPEPTEPVTETTEGGGGGSTQTPSEAVTEPPTATPEPTPEPPAPVEPTPPTPTTPAETDAGVFNPELPWIYQGDGVFVHGETGETVVEDVTDYDPYVIGEGYGRGTDPTEAVVGSGLGDTTEETGTGDIFGDIGTIFGDTTADVPVEPPASVAPKIPTTSTGKPTVTPTDGKTPTKSEPPPPTTVEPKVPTTSVDKPTDAVPTGGRTPTLPVEPPKNKPVTPSTEKPTVTTPTGTRTPTLPDETGGLGTSGVTDVTATEPSVDTGVDTTTTGGTGGGDGTGDGTGDGPGDGIGKGLLGLGLLSLGGGGAAPSTVLPEAFSQQLSAALTKIQLAQPYQSKDYLADLIARLQA